MLIQVFRHQIHSVKVICDHGIFCQLIVVEIQKYDRKIHVFLQIVDVIAARVSHQDQRIDGLLPGDARHDHLIFHLLFQDFHSHHTALFRRCQCHFLIHFPVKRRILCQIPLRNHNTDAAHAFSLRISRSASRLAVSHFLCNFQNPGAHLIADPFLSCNRVMHGDGADARHLCNICQSYFCHICYSLVHCNKVIQSADKIAPEIFHSKAGIHQHLAAVNLIGSFQTVFFRRIEAAQAYLA